MAMFPCSLKPLGGPHYLSPGVTTTTGTRFYFLDIVKIQKLEHIIELPQVLLQLLPGTTGFTTTTDTTATTHMTGSTATTSSTGTTDGFYRYYSNCTSSITGSTATTSFTGTTDGFYSSYRYYSNCTSSITGSTVNTGIQLLQAPHIILQLLPVLREL